MRLRAPTLLAATVLLLAVPTAARRLDPGELDDLAARRGQAVIEGGDTGDLEVTAAFVPEEMSAGALRGALEVLVRLAPGVPRHPQYRLSAILESLDGPPAVHHLEAEPAEVGAAAAWFYRVRCELSEEVQEVVLIVEETRSGLWGGTVVDLTEEALEPPADSAVVFGTRPWSLLPDGGSAEGEGEAEAGSDQQGSTVLRLLPPHRRDGSRFEALVADVGVSRVAFFLDGAEVGSRENHPYSVKIDLGSGGRPQTVKAVAYDAQGRELGSDTVVVNPDDRPFAIKISRLEGDPASGGVVVGAEVSVPYGSTLDRVELFWNQQRMATLESAPFVARLETPGGTGQDFVQAVAYLEDGTSREDVALLDGRGLGEEVDVTLVEVYAVVTDREGGPVRGLGPDDFELWVRGKRQRIERLGYADEEDGSEGESKRGLGTGGLVLGLVIDTSGSMRTILRETQQAAAQFLGQVLSPEDRAFLIDFDRLPRLRHPATSSLMDLVSSLSQLRADGYTTLYDSVIFSLLEFDEGRGRKALVVLTDGDDQGSRFGPNRVIEYAEELGVPVYVIGLQDPVNLRGLNRMELEAVTRETGGRLYFASGTDDLRQAYAEIEAELRSQYLLTFYVEEALSEEERRGIRVEVRGKGLSVRTVVSPD